MKKLWSRSFWRGGFTRSITDSGSTRLFSSISSTVTKVAAVLLFAAAPALAQQAVQVWQPLGYQNIALSTVVIQYLTVPSGARWAQICANNGPVRWRDDGFNVTSVSGMMLGNATTGSVLCMQYSGAMVLQPALNPPSIAPTTPNVILEFIAVQTAASIDVSYYR